ncbi:MAG: hypothetical protein U0L49_07565 [Eubacterium sp.]|nr:hypothetical protein [Eubacterium sp.]
MAEKKGDPIRKDQAGFVDKDIEKESDIVTNDAEDQAEDSLEVNGLPDPLDEGEYQENFNEEVDLPAYDEDADDEEADSEEDEAGSGNERTEEKKPKRPPVRRPKRPASPAREWLSDHLRYILLILAIAAVVVIIFLLATKLSGSSGNSVAAGSSSSEALAAASASADEEKGGSLEIVSESKAAETAASASSAGESVISASTASSGTASESTKGDSKESQLADADESVNALVTAYFDSLKNADSNELIESYSNIKCYTYPGQNEGTLVVFARADYKYKNYTETIPSLSEFYLAPDANGKLAMVETISDSDQEYLSEIEASPEVQALITEVSNAYDRVVSSNPDLKAYIESLS